MEMTSSTSSSAFGGFSTTCEACLLIMRTVDPQIMTSYNLPALNTTCEACLLHMRTVALLQGTPARSKLRSSQLGPCTRLIKLLCFQLLLLLDKGLSLETRWMVLTYYNMSPVPRRRCSNVDRSNTLSQKPNCYVEDGERVRLGSNKFSFLFPTNNNLDDGAIERQKGNVG